MQFSSSQAAVELGVSARQVRRAAAAGELATSKHGEAYSVSQRQLQAFARTVHRGRNWSREAQEAALDLLSTGESSTLTGPELARMRKRIRDGEVGVLAGRILRARVSLRRGVNEQTKDRFSASLTGELGLSSHGGLGVLVAVDAAREARMARLGLDDSGDIAVVEGDEHHRRVLEALALFAYGDARESSAAATWIAAQKSAL